MSNRSKERESFLGDIVIGFVEDFGSNGWRQIKGGTYKWDDDNPAGNTAVFIDRENDDKEHTVDIEVVARGLRCIRDRQVAINEQMRKNIVEADRENDAGQIDAYDADMIVQAGVFGELIYG